MALQMLFMALILWTANVLADCVTIHRQSGIANIVAYRLFSNQSLAIYDSRNHFIVYDSTGSVHYNETVLLPQDPLRPGKPFYPYAAVIGNSSELYVATMKNETFRYSAGKVDAIDYYADNKGFLYPYSCFTFRGLPNTPLMLFQNLVFMWSVNGTGTLDISDYNNGHASYINFSYIQKVSANPILNEYMIVTRNNIVYVANANYAAAWKFSPTRSQSAVTYQDSSVLMIITNLASNANYFAYCAFLTRDGSGRYAHRLVVRARSNWVLNAIVVIEDFYGYGVALHPTANIIYILSSHGDLYVSTFQTTSVFTVSTPVLKISGAGNKNSDLEVIDLTKLVIRTPGSIQIVDISSPSSSAIAIQTPAKPTFSRAIANSNNMFVVYANRMLSLVDTSTLSKSPLFGVSGIVREVVVNSDSSKPRFYVLFSNKIEVYSLTDWTLVISKSISQFETGIATAVGGVFQLTGLLDIDVLRRNTGYIVLITTGTLLGIKDTYISILAENSLAVAVSQASGIQALFTQVMTHTKTGSTVDYILLNMPDASYRWIFNDPSINAISGWVDLHLNPGNGDAIALAKKMVKMTYSKGTPRNDFEAGKWIFQLPDQYGYLRVKYDSTSWSPLDINTYNPWRRGTSLEYLKGSSSNKMGQLRIDCLDLVSNDFKSSRYCTEYLHEAVGIQRSTDNQLYFYTDDQSLTSISPDTCFAHSDLLAYYETASGSCDVANCAGCSILDYALCGLCNVGYYLSTDRRSCNSGCSLYEYQGFCVANCPIETYKTAGSPGICISKSACIAGSLMILGDSCGLVVYCPAGSTLSSGECLPDNGRAASADSLSTVTTPCSGSGQVYWVHFKMCVPSTGLPTSNYTVASNAAYCDGGTHWYNPSTGTCSQSCIGLEGTSTSMGRFCVASQADCLGLSFFIDELSSVSPLCAPSCNLNLIDTTNSHCVSQSSCLASGRRVLPLNSSCVSSCPVLVPYIRNGECQANCPTSTFLEESMGECVDTCPETTINNYCSTVLSMKLVSAQVLSGTAKVTMHAELFFKSNIQNLVRNLSVPAKSLVQNVILSPSETVATVDSVDIMDSIIIIQISSELIISSSGVTLVPTPNSFYANDIRTLIEQSSYSLQLSSKAMSPQVPLILKLLTKIAVVASASLTAVKVAAPLMISLGLDASTGNVLCLIAQTYTKLVMMTHFEFWLPDNSYSKMYYRVFREFLDSFNEYLLLLIVGQDMVNVNKQVVCDAMYEKFCMLTVEDSYFMAHLLALLIFFVHALLLYGASRLLCYLGKHRIGDMLKKNLKSVLPFAFLLESSLEFWFTMILSITIPYYRSLELGFIKSLGHIVLALFIGCFGMVVWKVSKYENRHSDLLSMEAKTLARRDIVVLKTVSETVCCGFKGMITEVATKKSSSNFVRVFIIHDFALALVLVAGSYAPKAQPFIWAACEVALVFLIIKYNSFKSQPLFWRQLIIESLFVVLSIHIGISNIISTSNLMPTYVILGVSLAILLLDLGFTVWLLSTDLLKLFRKNKAKKAGNSSQLSSQPETKLTSILVRASSRITNNQSFRGNSKPPQDMGRFDINMLRVKSTGKHDRFYMSSNRSLLSGESSLLSPQGRYVKKPSHLKGNFLNTVRPVRLSNVNVY